MNKKPTSNQHQGQNQDAFDGMANTLQQLDASVTNLKKAIADLTDNQSDLSAQVKKNTKDLKDNANGYEAVEDALDTVNAKLNAHMKLMSSTKTQLQNNQTQLSSLKKTYDELTKSQKANAGVVKDAEDKIEDLTKSIKEENEALASSKKEFDFHAESLNVLKDAFDDIKAKAGTFAPDLEEASKGFDVLKTGLDAAKTGFNSVSEAIETTGFGLLLIVVKSVVEYLTKTSEGAKVLKGLLNILHTAIEAVEAY